jgi:RND family efflux transporter MFP subunit
MKRKSFIFILAFIGIMSAIWAIKRGVSSAPQTLPVSLPPQKPYSNTVAASGIIECAGDNFSIGSSTNGVVQEIYAKVGQQVKKGDPLFMLDNRELESELRIAEAKEKVAKAECYRILDQLSRLRAIKDLRAISQDDLKSKENEARIARAKLTQMHLEKEKASVLLDRMIIRSPIDGIVLQQNIHIGEYFSSNNNDQPSILLGNIKYLQIRADIDEQNASRITGQPHAIAYPKNRPSYSIPLTFSHIEPYVVPKISLTGSSREKVDTRVLQIIYTFEPPSDVSLYIGQQVDVFLKLDTGPS